MLTKVLTDHFEQKRLHVCTSYRRINIQIGYSSLVQQMNVVLVTKDKEKCLTMNYRQQEK